MFIHGLEGSSQGVKATLLRSFFPQILTPDFRGDLNERMDALENLLGDINGWILIGSSFGGLMAALFARQHPQQVARLILLAPALIWPDFVHQAAPPITVPTVIYHGSQDNLIPLHDLRAIAKYNFINLTFHEVDDDHGLYKTVHSIDWHGLLEVT